MTRPEPASLESIIRALNNEFLRNLANRDLDALVDSFYAEDARVLPPNHPMVEGRARIREFFGGLLAGGMTDLKLETQKIERSTDLACEIGKYSMTLAAGGEPIGDQGKYMVVFRRQGDGSWKAVADMFNSDQPVT